MSRETMKKTLAIIIPHLGFGGQERIAVTAAEGLKDEYNVVILVFQRWETEIPVEDIPVVNLNLPARSSLLAKIWQVLRRNCALRRCKRELRIDIALSVGDIANVSNAFSRQREAVVLWVHGQASVPRGFWRCLASRRVYKRARRVVCVSAQLRNDLAYALKMPMQRFDVLYNGVPLERIREKAQAPAALPAGRYILAVGRLEDVKGYDHLLRAFAIVCQRVADVVLVLVGDGSNRACLEALSSTLGLADRVVFTGLQSNPYGYMKRAELVVLSSCFEGFPMVILEAMACGTPVVSVACPSGPRELLARPDEASPQNSPALCTYGVLTPPFSTCRNVEHAVEALLAEGLLLLLEDSALRAWYAKRAAKRAEAFSDTRFFEGLRALLDI